MTEEIKKRKMEFEVKVVFKVEAENIETGKEMVEGIFEAMKLKVKTVKHISGKRSESFNNAFHLWLEQVAQEAIKRGLTIDMLIKKPAKVPITSGILKELVRFTGKTMFKKDSTAKLTNDELSELVQIFDNKFISDLDIDIPFPNLQLLIDKEENNY